MQYCKNCSKEISSPLKFCSKSCSASFNNRGVRRHGNPKTACLQCGKITKNSTSKFCSNQCRADFDWLIMEQQIKTDQSSTWRSIRKYLLSISNKCQICNTSTWNNLPITLECDHIDGDKSNNRLSNARLICPNCHSQTPTYKAKNISNPKGKDIRARRYKK